MANLDTRSAGSRDDWETPWKVFHQIENMFGPFDLDAAASWENRKCACYIPKENDALVVPWHATNVFCNPPYGKMPPLFLNRAYMEVDSDHCERAVILMAARLGTKWFRQFKQMADTQRTNSRKRPNVSVILWPVRIPFTHPEATKKNGAQFESMLVVIDKQNLSVPVFPGKNFYPMTVHYWL